MQPLELAHIASLMNVPFKEKSVRITGYSIDSRGVLPGDLFFALPGAKVDGHHFLKEVQEKGASAAIVRSDYENSELQLPLIKVPDVIVFLQQFAKKILEQRQSKVIAITGSVGKTTTKDFLFSLLKTTYRTFCSPSSYNSQVTLPLSILLAEGNEEFLILEMAMTHSGQISKLVEIAPPFTAGLTNIAVQHACNFSDGLAGIAREKSAIFSHPHTKFGFIPKDLAQFEEVAMVGSCEKRTFSCKNAQADYVLECDNVVKIFENGNAYELSLNIPIKALFHNFLLAVSIARELGVSWEKIREASSRLTLPSMRFEIIEKEGITFVNDAYNANPDSMKAALESLPKPKNGNKTIAILSEMTELGMYSEVGHATVAEKALHHVDMLFCIGQKCEVMKKIWKREKKPVELFELKEQLGLRLKEVALPGDIVLLKGARSWGLDQLLKLYN